MSNHAQLRFYAELNDFLPPERQKRVFMHSWNGQLSLGQLIEALGVPADAVELVLVNGSSLDFSYGVRDGDRVSVYPVFESLDITPLLRVRERPLRELRFVVDSRLRRLVISLRRLGFDTCCGQREEDLVCIARSERRILLTPRCPLLTRVTHGHCIRASRPREQLIGVIARLDLYASIALLKRCPWCNGLLQPYDNRISRGGGEKEEPVTQEHANRWDCPECHRMYQKGHYYRHTQAWVRRLLRPCADRLSLKGAKQLRLFSQDIPGM